MPRARPSGRCVLEGLKHDVEVAADSRPRSVIGAKRRLAARQRPLILFSCTYQHDRRSEWTLPSRRPDTTRTPARTAVQDGHPGLACWTARADTKADAHRGRPHGRTRSSDRLQPPGAIPNAGVIARGARHVQGGR
jgi:hypothetical protein